MMDNSDQWCSSDNRSSPHALRSSRPRGFTLIELLVVVAIIALLISILLPSLNRAREQAKQVVCMTQLKQIHLATELYVTENDGWYPPTALLREDGRIFFESIIGYLKPYLNDNQEIWNDQSQFDMPDYIDTRRTSDGIFKEPNSELLFPVHYSFNRFVYPALHLLSSGEVIDVPLLDAGEKDSGKPKNSTTVPRPGDTLAIFGFHPPVFGWGVFLRHNDVVRIRHDPLTLTLNYDPAQIHFDEGLNIIFVDGHAQYIDADAFTDTKSNEMNEMFQVFSD